MPAASFVTFTSANLGIISLFAALIAIAIAVGRRIALPVISRILMAAGLILLAAAAAGPVWNYSKSGSIAVMVDLSPSTRGAHFRNPDFLRQRLDQLIGSAPHQLIGFASQNRPLDLAGPFTEMPADQTNFSALAADAILLFSDARFDPPETSSPIYIAVDDDLENVPDAAVQKLDLHGQSLAATISNTGAARQASFPNSIAPIADGTIVITRPLSANDSRTTVELNHADLWPENDSLSLQIPPPTTSEKWWIGENPPGLGWKLFSPAQLPDLPEAYLAPSVIVIDNEPAELFAPPAFGRLTQYIRDLGGSLLILGGNSTSPTAAPPATILEQISPLASFPPTPTTRWILLIDASGSMSQQVGNISRWQAAADAIVRLLPALPPADPVLIGQFSDIIKWWLPAESAAVAAKASLPPSDAFPHGPTNLESALNQIADQTEENLPTELLLLSDCDAQIEHPDDLANRLHQKNIHLHVLAIDHGSALETIRNISKATGGATLSQFNPQQWIQSFQDLYHSSLPPAHPINYPITIVFQGEAKSLASATSRSWKRTWLKTSAQSWASASAENATIPMAAFWHVGSGSVAATAFQPDPAQIESLANLIARRPRDPRFSVRFETGSKIHFIVDAIKAGKFLNDLPITVEFAGDGEKHSMPLDQTAPGRYELTTDSPRTSQIATLTTAGETIDRITIAGRYPPEFDAVGNDHAAMRKLADITHGQIIWPTDHTPIHFNWTNIPKPLAPWICLLALSFISAGLIYWRLMQSNAD